MLGSFPQYGFSGRLHFLFLFSYNHICIMTGSFGSFKLRVDPFCIECKRCRATIAAPIQTMPDTWIVAACPLCGERRRYLPAELFNGVLSSRFEEWRWQTGKRNL
jgi:hypothetical protein